MRSLHWEADPVLITVVYERADGINKEVMITKTQDGKWSIRTDSRQAMVWYGMAPLYFGSPLLRPKGSSLIGLFAASPRVTDKPPIFSVTNDCGMVPLVNANNGKRRPMQWKAVKESEVM